MFSSLFVFGCLIVLGALGFLCCGLPVSWLLVRFVHLSFGFVFSFLVSLC